MKVAILGFGVEGQAAYEYWKAGNDVTVCDQNDQISVPVGVSAKLGEHYLDNLAEFDILVRSPFVQPAKIVRANTPDILERVTSNTNEFFRVCPTKNIIGVTGTKGKGTTSTLIAKMLESAGKKVHLGGNIGVAALQLLKEGIQPDDWVVLELSSFQLMDLKYSPHIAVCLMVVPEHLDFHTDSNEYFTAKSQLFRRQRENDISVYFADNENSKQIASPGKGQKIPYFAPPGAFVDNDTITIGTTAICKIDELKLLGAHNWQNACAAVTTVWQITQNTGAIRSVLVNFTGLEHRLELVREYEGVTYYDDSFGTTPETAIVAIEAFEQPKVIILGGYDKHVSFDALAAKIKGTNVREAIIIGQTAEKIKASLRQVGFDNFRDGGHTMAEIINAARNTAQPGDVVLLSPACASWDMFKDYKERAEQFKQAVNAL